MKKAEWQTVFNISVAVAAALLAITWAIGFARGDPDTTSGSAAAFVLLLALPVLAVLIAPGGRVTRFIVAVFVFLAVDAATVLVIPLHDDLFLGEQWGFVLIYMIGAAVYWWWYRRTHPEGDGER